MDEQLRCRLSDPVQPHFLSRQDNPPPSECFKCGPDGRAFKDGDWHYYCDICKLVFHNGDCNARAGRQRHPYHLNHFLNITIQISETETQSFSNSTELRRTIHRRLKSKDRCDWCGKELRYYFHRCLVCGFSLDHTCVDKDPPFTITNLKSHQHPLNLFPRPLLVPCSACGLADQKEEPGYVCLPCNYVVHKSCIDLPRVIKLTRHPHRLSYTAYLPPPSKRSCGVCHRNVDVKYGMFSCTKGCSYAVHSQCATHSDIWDGKDLEGEPEEPEEDIAPFEVVGHNLIKHFSHEHHLRFDEDEDMFTLGGDKDCRVCCRSINSRGFYACTIMHCDFFLHVQCAQFPKKIEHPIHKHPLILQSDVGGIGYDCLPCRRLCNGFRYKCLNNSCKAGEVYLFQMDVICASVCEPFQHKVHPHPLILFSGRGMSSTCGICSKYCQSIFALKCNDCEFSMCFECATIPEVIHYKHDKHPLTLSGGEGSSDPYWCEKCEKQIDPKKWFYTCDQCCTTLHIDCVFEDSSYIRVGCGCGDNNEDGELTVVSNNGNSRPFCSWCRVRCQYRIVYKEKGNDRNMCSVKCLRNHTEFIC